MFKYLILLLLRKTMLAVYCGLFYFNVIKTLNNNLTMYSIGM